MNTSTLSTNYIHRPLGQSALLSVLLLLACFGLAPQARATCQQGCDLTNGNTFLGDDALVNDQFGGSNTAIGETALYNNVTGYANTATGADALRANTVGHDNTAIGNSALSNSTNTRENTATGSYALYVNTNGNYNTVTGAYALFNNVTGDYNTAIGKNALYRNTGSHNVALGASAGVNLTTGSGNVCLGASVYGNAGESNTTWIKNIYASVASGRAVYVNADNKIGTLVSSRRFKEEIKPMDKASEAILALKPVTFRYKKEIESSGSIMFGLIAEDVEKADSDLVTRNEKGEVETVRYEAVNAMLLNEFLKEHQTVQELKKQVAELTAGLQKVSAELELNKRAPETVSNNH
jgi:trimeric autotransporter adhesin